MSAATRSCTPLRPAASAAPMTPPVGPEPSRETARRCTDWGGMTPPLDWHQQNLAVEAGPVQLLNQLVDVGADPRRHVRVDEGRGGALEFGCPREHLVRQRDVRDVGELLEDQLAGAPLVVGVDEAEEEAHGDRFHAELLQPPHAAAHRRFVEGEDDVALEVAALRDGDAGPPPCDRYGRRRGRVPNLLLVVPPELDLVAVPLRGEEPGGGAAHLDHRVVGRGRPVHEGLDGAAERLRVQAEGLGQLLDARQHTPRLVVGGRRRLVQDDLAVRRDADEVGERAAHVDAHPVATLRHARPPRPPSGGTGEARS